MPTGTADELNLPLQLLPRGEYGIIVDDRPVKDT